MTNKKQNRIKIELPSRYHNVKTTLEQTNNPNIFKVNTNSGYIRFMYDAERCVETNKIKHLDFEGGPFISLGNSSIYEGHTLKEIKQTESELQLIFEKNEDKE